MEIPNALGNLQKALAANVKFAPHEAIGNFVNGLPFNKHQFISTKDVKKKLLKRPSVIYNRPGAPFAAIIPGDSVVETVTATGLLNFLTVCDPYLNLFRGLIPPLGGTLDFSPILAFVVLNVFTSTAAALPAELPATSPEAKKQQEAFSFAKPSPLQAVMQHFRLNRTAASRSQA